MRANLHKLVCLLLLIAGLAPAVVHHEHEAHKDGIYQHVDCSYCDVKCSHHSIALLGQVLQLKSPQSDSCKYFQVASLPKVAEVFGKHSRAPPLA